MIIPSQGDPPITDEFTTKGFADYLVENRGCINTFLEKIDLLIDWTGIEKCFLENVKKVLLPMEGFLILHYRCLNCFYFKDGMD